MAYRAWPRARADARRIVRRFLFGFSMNQLYRRYAYDGWTRSTVEDAIRFALKQSK